MYAALATLVVTAVVAFLISYTVAAVVLLAGTVGVFLLHKRDVEARITRLTYDLDGEAAARFASVQKACKAFSDANKVWRVEGEAREGYSPGEEVLSFNGGVSRSLVEVGLLEMPGISTNVDIWGIKTDAVSLFFLPEGVLWYKDDRYRAISYDSLNVAYRPVRSIEEGEVPEDAEIVGETWRHVKSDGNPDIRYPSNPRYTIALYGLVSMTGTEPNLRLLVSNTATAASFARMFSANQSEEHPRGQGGADTARAERARRRAEAEAERIAPLLEVLGLESGASQKEIGAAYKKKAKMYHPDMVASMAPEDRETAELRMKEINAAYAELKLRAVEE